MNDYLHIRKELRLVTSSGAVLIAGHFMDDAPMMNDGRKNISIGSQARLDAPPRVGL